MSDQTIISIVGSVIGLIGTMFTGWMLYKMQQLKQQADATTRVTEATAKVADATHTLVNKNMSVQLRLNASLSRRVADLTREPVDILAASEAERQRDDHDIQQRKVDADNPNGLQKAAKSIPLT